MTWLSSGCTTTRTKGRFSRTTATSNCRRSTGTWNRCERRTSLRCRQALRSATSSTSSPLILTTGSACETRASTLASPRCGTCTAHGSRGPCWSTAGCSCRQVLGSRSLRGVPPRVPWRLSSHVRAGVMAAPGKAGAVVDVVVFVRPARCVRRVALLTEPSRLTTSWLWRRSRLPRSRRGSAR